MPAAAPTTPTPKKKKHRRKHHKPPTPPRNDGPGASDIPSSYLKLYHAAAQAHNIDWRVLAAIGKNESDHGRTTLPGVSSGVNFAGCCAGPMQMCIKASCGNVWQAYAVEYFTMPVSRSCNWPMLAPSWRSLRGFVCC